jgi:hypothetical protein
MMGSKCQNVSECQLMYDLYDDILVMICIICICMMIICPKMMLMYNIQVIILLFVSVAMLPCCCKLLNGMASNSHTFTALGVYHCLTEGKCNTLWWFDKANWRITIFNGENHQTTSIINGPFSIAMLNIQTVYPFKILFDVWCPQQWWTSCIQLQSSNVCHMLREWCICGGTLW